MTARPSVFAGGPGYDATKTTQLNFANGKTEVIEGGAAFVTSHFQDSTAYASVSFGGGTCSDRCLSAHLHCAVSFGRFHKSAGSWFLLLK